MSQFLGTGPVLNCIIIEGNGIVAQDDIARGVAGAAERVPAEPPLQSPGRVEPAFAVTIAPKHSWLVDLLRNSNMMNCYMNTSSNRTVTKYFVLLSSIR